MMLDEKSAKEIGSAFGKDARWASNQMADIRVEFGARLEHFETVIHTCQLGEIVAVMEDGIHYVEDGVDFRALPAKCRCKKELTREETSRSVDAGEAQRVVQRSLNSKGEVTAKPVNHQVWAPQSSRIHRVGLTSAAHIHRAATGSRRDKLDIEVAYEIAMEERAKWIRELSHDDRAAMEREQPTLLTRPMPCPSVIVMPQARDKHDRPETDVFGDGVKCIHGIYIPVASPSKGNKHYCLSCPEDVAQHQGRVVILEVASFSG